jgi:MFS transporter, DHA1 family, purine base/nucleoside efflux pump
MKRTTFVILCLEGAVLSFNVAATAALVPAIASDFALSQFLVGKIIWAYMIPYGIAALIYGPLIRAFDAKKVELVCLVLFSLANLMAGVSRDIYTLFLARFFMGLFGASVIPLGLILIAKHIDSRKRGRFVGIFFSSTFIASLMGLFLSAILHWRLIFIIPAIFGLILWIHVYFYLPSFKEDCAFFRTNPSTTLRIDTEPRQRRRECINYLAALKDKEIAYIFTYIFLISLFYHGIQQWLGVYFSSKFRFSQFLISMLVTLSSLSGIFGEALGGWMSDALGRIKVINLGIILMVLSAFLFVFKLPIFILAILMLSWGLGWTFNHAGISTALTDLPQNFLNEAASLNSSVRFLSGGIGVAVGGWLMQQSFTLGFIVFGLGLLALLSFTKILKLRPVLAAGREEI